jgi:hypothetical protein
VVTSFTLVFFTGLTNAQSLYQQILSLVDSVSTINLANHIQWLEEPGGHNSRVNFTPGNDSAAVYIKSEFDKIPGLASVEYDTFYIPSATPPLNVKPMVNVIATLEGSADPDIYFVIGAHLDCSASRMVSTVWNAQWQTIKAPGADDNATGIAAIIEIARILADPVNNFQHSVTLKFIAFGAEESGPAYSGSHHGSRHFAKFAKQNNHDIRGMVSIDMIGYNNDYDFQAIVSNTASLSFADMFTYANDIFSIDLILNESPYAYGTYSDHDTFWDENYPAILFIENAPPWNNSPYYIANPFYHTSSDTYETVNMSLVTKVTKLNLASFAALSAPLTGAAENEIKVPEEFSLSQNYPNPFNPTTKIKYQVPSNMKSGISNVKITVYDMLGNEVATLVNEAKNRGTYEVEFNASESARGHGISSGIYFYRLQAGEYIQTKSMVLVK